jgi:dienelactone hydrolase
MNAIKRALLLGEKTVVGFIERNWKASIRGLVVYILVLVFIMGFFFYTGAGKWFDFSFTLVTAFLSIVIGIFISLFVLKVLAKLPNILVSWILGAVVGVITLGTYLGPFFTMMGYCILILGAWTGLSIKLVRSARKRRGLTFVALGSATLLLHGLFLFSIFSEGEEGAWSLEAADEAMNPSLANPAAIGENTIKSFTYGSGEDQRREEYRDVTYQTNTVNMSSFIVHPKGFNKWYREWFWGFDLNKAPLNGRVWMPDESSEGPFPLVLMVHGNHNMADFSDGGYEYLGELLASKGYIAVSIDQNFLNSGKTGHIGWDNAGRAWMFLKHLDQWGKWNKDKQHPLYGKVDMENIGLIGHSRGGEAVSLATLMNDLDRLPNNAKVTLNFDFSIKALIGLSPGDGRFKLGDQPVELKDINYLTIQGANDTDHTNYYGIRQYERVSFSDDFDGFKSSIYLYGANHGQFNSDWEVDQPSPYWWFMNRKEIMEPELQREMTKVYVAAFLDATLKGREEYRQIFSTKGTASSWIPTDPVRVKYEDNTFTPLATYEEDVDVTTLTQDEGELHGFNLQVWKEVNLTLRNNEPQGNEAVKLGWRGTNGRYTVKLPDEVSETLGPQTVLSFDAVQLHPSRYDFYGIRVPEGFEEKAIPITVMVKPKGTMKLDSRIGTTVGIEPTYSTKLYKFDWWNERFGNNYEHMLQTYEVPLTFLQENMENINYQDINEIIFEFNQTGSGLIFLDNIGLKERIRTSE